MSPDGLLTFLPMLVYPARSCHCLPEGSSGHIMFFPCSAPSVPPCHQLNSVHISQCDIQSFFCCRPSWPFYPDLGSVCILLFSQASFLGFPVNTPCIFFASIPLLGLLLLREYWILFPIPVESVKLLSVLTDLLSSHLPSGTFPDHHHLPAQ